MQIFSPSHLAISSTVQASACNHAYTLTRCTAEGSAVEAGGPQYQRYRQAAVASAALTTPSAKLPPRPYGRAHTATAGLETVRCSAADQVFLFRTSTPKSSLPFTMRQDSPLAYPTLVRVDSISYSGQH